MGLMRNIETIARAMQEVAEIARRWESAEKNKTNAETPEANDRSEIRNTFIRLRRDNWRASEDKILKDAIAAGYTYEFLLEKLPNRTYSSIASRAKRLGLRYQGPNNGTLWTPDEDKVLIDNWRKGYTIEEIAAKIPGRTIGGVLSRYYTLELNK